MKISTRLTFLCAVVGGISLSAAEIAADTLAETPAAPVVAPKLSGASEARVRAMENFMTATASRDRDERLSLFVEVLRDDPGAVPPREFIRGLVETRADARKVASKLLEIAKKNPKQLGLAALAGQMCYAANMVPSEYLGTLRDILDGVSDPARLPDEEKSSYYSIVGVYSSALKQARDYRTGSAFLESELDRDESPFREMMLRFAIDFEHFFSRYGDKASRWFGLADSDREAAGKRFEQLFAECDAQEKTTPVEDLDRYIDFCIAVGKPQTALRAAERLAVENKSPQNRTRLAYVAIEAKAFDKVPPIVAELSKLDGWKGVSQLISINSLLAQGKYDQAQKEIAELKVPMARDEFMSKPSTTPSSGRITTGPSCWSLPTGSKREIRER